MLNPNASPAPTAPQGGARAVSEPREDLAPQEPMHPEHEDADGSWRSHLWFGLGTAALVVPYFIPGVPRGPLLVAYLGLGAVLMIAPIVWGVIEGTRAAFRHRQNRKRSWLI